MNNKLLDNVNEEIRNCLENVEPKDMRKYLDEIIKNAEETLSMIEIFDSEMN